MARNVLSRMISYVIIFCIALSLNLCPMIYLGQGRHLLPLHLKIPKPGEY